VVVEHPEITEPATLEVFPDELGELQSAERLVRLEYYPPEVSRPQQLTVSVATTRSRSRSQQAFECRRVRLVS
jgi:hypothetical protein